MLEGSGLGEFLSVLCALLWAAAVIFFRLAGAGVSPFGLNLFKNVISTALLIPTILLIEPTAWQLFSEREVWALVASGLIGIAIGDTLFLRALNIIGASRQAILDTLFGPFVIMLSLLFLGETVGLWHGVGFAMVLAGVLLVVYRRPRMDVPAPTLGTGLAIGVLAVFTMACGIILTKPVVEEQGLLTVVFIRLAAATLGQLAWAGITGNLMRVAAEFRKPLPWPHMLAGTMLGAYLAMIVWIGGYKYTDASIAAVLNKTSVFWVLIFAALFLKEAADWRRWLGAGLGFAGVVVLVVLGGP